jgi:protein ImuB
MNGPAHRSQTALAQTSSSGLIRRWGWQGEAISPRFEAPLISAERRFFDPISQLDDVKAVALSLAGQAAKALERRVEGGRVFELSLFRVDGAVQKFRVGTSSPLRDPKRVLRLFAEKLKADEGAIDAGFGYDLVRLDVLVADKAPAVQSALTANGAVEANASLDHLVDRLGARLGSERVTRLLPVDRHLPESQTGYVPAAFARQDALVWSGFLKSAAAPDLHRARASANPQLGFAEDTRPAEEAKPSSWQEGLMTRPLRLIEPAEEVEALAMVPDGPPLRFRWRRSIYQVIRSEGPERIAPPWWIGANDRPSEAKEGVTRDYFRIEDTEGRRFWLYREGLYERETSRPRWYLQGLFA